MEKKSSVDVVIPIYNEEKELDENIRKLHSFLREKGKSFSWRIIIADNASTDNSIKIAQKLAKTRPQVTVRHLVQKGRGLAVKTVWQESDADYLAYMDVDLSTDLDSFPRMVRALQNGYDIAIGSRLLPQSIVRARTIKREVLSRGYNILIQVFFGVHFTDAQCGFKIVNRRVVKNLIPHIQDNAWFFDSELLIVAEKMKYRIYEDPVLWIDNPGSTVRVLGTVKGDLLGLWRLFRDRPWKQMKSVS